MVTFFFATWVIVSLNGVLLEPMSLFSKFSESFGIHSFNISEVKDQVGSTNRNVDQQSSRALFFQVLGDQYNNDNVYELRYEAYLETEKAVPLHVLLIQVRHI